MSKKLNCILLIDDDEDDNFFHQLIIDKLNITDQVVIAESGYEALDFLTNTVMAPDLIFLDINMPRMNGWEFMKEYNNLYLAQSKPVIITILTTSANPYEREQSKKIRGIAGFASKPLTEETMNDIIKSHFPNLS